MKVFVTGMGLACSLGQNIDDFWSAMTRGHAGIRRIQRFDVSDLPVQIGGEIHHLNDPDLDALIGRRIDRATAFGIYAARDAIKDAGLDSESLPAKTTVIIGSGLAGLDSIQHQTDILNARGPRRVSPFTIPMLMPNATAASVANEFQIHGPAYTLTTACASSAYAVADAARQIRSGLIDVAIVGGTESSLSPLGLAAFAKMGAATTEANNSPSEAVKPFDRNRSGLVMSEGAAILILESEQSVAARKTKPLAEVIGWATNHDAHHQVKPEPSGKFPAQAIVTACQEGGVIPEAIAPDTYVNAHGTATIPNDRMETNALKAAFGPSAYQLQISSTKSMTGHLIGAASALESIVCIQTLRHGFIPPTMNLRHQDADCDLDCVPNRGREAAVQYAINLGFAFGGHNACLIFKKHH